MIVRHLHIVHELLTVLALLTVEMVMLVGRKPLSCARHLMAYNCSSQVYHRSLYRSGVCSNWRSKAPPRAAMRAPLHSTSSPLPQLYNDDPSQAVFLKPSP
jgi:hypothetical protein